MRFFHLSDLHIGKQLSGYNLRESQEQVLSQIVFYAEKEQPDAILISGDIYDKSVPSGEAHTIFDSFLNQIAGLKPAIPVLIIAGNHDSPERLRFASGFLKRHQIHISVMPPQTEEEHLERITLTDEWGPVTFYLFPFLKPGYVRQLLPEAAAAGYDSAFRGVLGRETVEARERNVILAHQFFIRGSQTPDTCDSELLSLTVGGIDQIDAGCLEPFEYAALGHLHGPQQVGKPTVRYCGSPLKYSVSEATHSKSITLVTLGEKGSEVLIEQLPLQTDKDVRSIRGQLSDIIAAAGSGICHDYVSITLTDEEEASDFRERLDEVYDHILEIRMDNTRTRSHLEEESGSFEFIDPFTAFSHFYEAVSHQPLTDGQELLIKQIVDEVRGEDA